MRIITNPFSPSIPCIYEPTLSNLRSDTTKCVDNAGEGPILPITTEVSLDESEGVLDRVEVW